MKREYTILQKHKGWAVVYTPQNYETVYTTTRKEARVLAKAYNTKQPMKWFKA